MIHAESGLMLDAVVSDQLVNMVLPDVYQLSLYG